VFMMAILHIVFSKGVLLISQDVQFHSRFIPEGVAEAFHSETPTFYHDLGGKSLSGRTVSLA
jgi:hypothetical protein